MEKLEDAERRPAERQRRRDAAIRREPDGGGANGPELGERALCDRTRRTEIRGGVHAPGGAGDEATLAALPENRTRSTGNPGG